MNALEKHRQTWAGKSDEWLFERLDNELKQKVEVIHQLLSEREANAKLIAAAPDLLAALKALLKSHYILDDSYESTPVEKLAEAAIEKATK